MKLKSKNSIMIYDKILTPFVSEDEDEGETPKAPAEGGEAEESEEL